MHAGWLAGCGVVGGSRFDWVTLAGALRCQCRCNNVRTCISLSDRLVEFVENSPNVDIDS